MDSSNPNEKIKHLHEVIKKIAQENTKMVELVEDFIKSSEPQWPQDQTNSEESHRQIADWPGEDTVDNHMIGQGNSDWPEEREDWPGSGDQIDWSDQAEPKKTVDWPEETVTENISTDQVDWPEEVTEKKSTGKVDWPEPREDWPEPREDWPEPPQDWPEEVEVIWPQERKISDWTEEDRDISDWQDEKKIDWQEEKQFTWPQQSLWNWSEFDDRKWSNYDRDQWRRKGSVDDDDNSADMADVESKDNWPEGGVTWNEDQIGYRENHQENLKRISYVNWPNWDKVDDEW